MDYSDYLKRWRAAGLIDDTTADSIRACEAAGSKKQPNEEERPSLIEALLYLGLVVVAVGVVAVGGHLGGELVFGKNYLPF